MTKQCDSRHSVAASDLDTVRDVVRCSGASVGPLLALESFQPTFRRSLLVGAAIGSAVALTPAVHAQSSDEPEHTLDTVTVTGQHESPLQAPIESSNLKLTAPLLDTPRSVTVVPEALMRERNDTTLTDVLRGTPGITLGSGEGGTPTGDRPFLRGYEASTDIFIDGVRDYVRGSHETFNLESVEIIKGPSSAFSGRGGTGGSINLITKKPKLGRFTDISAGFGNSGQWRTTLDSNFQLDDTVAMRLNFMKMGGDVPGRDHVGINRLGFAPSIAFGLGTPTRFSLDYSHLENRDTPDQGIPFRNLGGETGRKTPPRVKRSNYYGRRYADFRINRLQTLTATFEHDFSPAAKLRNITRYGKTLNSYLFTRPSFDNCPAGSSDIQCQTEGPDAEFRRGNRLRWRSSRALINQTDVSGQFATGAYAHQYIAGIELSKEKIYNRAMDGAPAEENGSLWRPDPNQRYDFHLTYGPRELAGEIKTRSLYFIDTVDLNDSWALNAGLRYDHYDVSDTRLSRKDSFWNYQLGVVYKPVEYGSVYASFSTSSNPAGENLGQGGGADGVGGAAPIRDVKPEKSRSWELGTKWDLLQERLTVTAAIFETRKTDARSTDPVSGDVTLDGKNRVRGFELGVSGRVMPGWDVWAAYTYLDPKVLSYQSGANVFDGKRMKFIARQSASLWTSYQLMPGLTVGGGAIYTGMRYVDDANEWQLPGGTRLDLMARYEFNQQLDLQFNINNAGNKRLYDASHVGLFALMAPGRSYMLTANYRF